MSKSRAEIVAELATAHGGDVQLACDMISAARDAGCDTVKIQSYSLERLNPSDPQADWLRQAHLDKSAHKRLMRHAQDCGVKFLSTPFDAEALRMLRKLGLRRFKIASSEAHRAWWRSDGEFLVSWPWGQQADKCRDHLAALFGGHAWVVEHHLTAIPLYPTPLEAVSRAPLLDGWSDHCEGIAACQWALARGAKVIEAHFCLPGRSRVRPWDKTPEQMRQIRDFAESVATITSGVNETFRTRWRTA